jgi:hypothetical protein
MSEGAGLEEGEVEALWSCVVFLAGERRVRGVFETMCVISEEIWFEVVDLEV